MKEIKILGIDLAKTNFSICGLSDAGEVVLKKSLNRQELIEFTAKLSPCTIGLEACGGSHYWGRLFARQGHQVKMMSVFRVKAFCPPQKKNDAADAQAIAVAASQPSVASIRVKEIKDQDLDILRNLREQLVKQRVALINQAHALCLEYGLPLPKRKSVPNLGKIFEALEDASSELSPIAREVVWQLLEEAKMLNAKTEQIEKRLESLLVHQENYKLLRSIPGVGLLTAAAVLSHTGGQVEQFKNGRQFAAYIGLVPRQYSTGGRSTLKGITKSGLPELRRLLVIGSRTVMIRSGLKKDKVSVWAHQKKTHKGFMIANVALANKMARVVYAVLKKQEPYRLVFSEAV